MKLCLLPALLAAIASITGCSYFPSPPMPPSTGVSLDRGPRGERSPRETRYLEQEATVQSEPGVGQTPGGPMPPTEAGVPPPPDTTSPQPPPPTTGTAAGGPASSAAGDTTAAPAANAELPYGVPVPGKKGFIYSPYDKSAGFVDVQGIAPGTKVRCPYTGKIFRVP